MRTNWGWFLCCRDLRVALLPWQVFQAPKIIGLSGAVTRRMGVLLGKGTVISAAMVVWQVHTERKAE